LRLVGEHAQLGAFRLERGERLLDAGERFALGRDVRAIVRDEGVDQAGQAIRNCLVARHAECLAQHAPRAETHQMAQIGEIRAPPSFGHKHGVQCAEQVRCGVHQRAVEVENQGREH